MNVGDKATIDLGRDRGPAHGRTGIITDIFAAPARAAVSVREEDGTVWTVAPQYVKGAD